MTGNILELVGCFGLVLIGTFDLNPFNAVLRKVHGFGAFLGIGTIAGFFWQQYIFAYYENNYKYLIFPVIITVIAFASLLLWQYFCVIADTFPPASHWLKHSNKMSCFQKLVFKCGPSKKTRFVTNYKCIYEMCNI